MALFVGGALTVTAPAGADAPAPMVTKCVRFFGITEVRWDQAWVDQHFGKGSKVTKVVFSYSPFNPGEDSRGGEIQGNSPTATTPFVEESVQAFLSFNGKEGLDDSFVTDEFDCSLFGHSHQPNPGRHLAKGRRS